VTVWKPIDCSAKALRRAKVPTARQSKGRIKKPTEAVRDRSTRVKVVLVRLRRPGRCRSISEPNGLESEFAIARQCRTAIKGPQPPGQICNGRINTAITAGR